MNHFHTSLVLALLTSSALAGCGADPGDDGAVALTTLSATIGPEGGVLAGAPGTLFEGVRVEIPAGALARPTALRVSAAFDATPLPHLASRVGVQFAVEPADASLALPARITVPFQPELVARLAAHPVDAKVWARGDAGWTLLEAQSFTDATVTVSAPHLGLLAAGVVKATTLPACGATCRVPVMVATQAPCVSATGFCATSLGFASPAVDSGAFAVNAAGTAIFYTAQTGPQTLQGQRRVLHGGGTQHMATVTAPAPLRGPSVGLVVDPVDESLWVGTFFAGNARLPLSGAAQYFDAGGRGFGAVLTRDGTLTRITDTGRSARRAGQTLFGAQVAWSPGFFAQDAAAADLSTPDGYWLVSEGHHNGGTVGPGTVTIGPVLGGNIGRDVARFNATANTGRVTVPTGTEMFTDVRASSAGLVAATIWNGDGWTVGVGDGSTALRRVAGVGSLHDFAFARDGGLWVAAESSPEVFCVSRDGGISTALLTAADPAAPAYAAAIARSILVLPDDTLLVLNESGEFVQLRRQGQ